MDGLSIEFENGQMTVFVECEIDHHTASRAREEIDREFFANMPRRVVLDLTNMRFMDSSGLGLIMGRYSRCLASGCEFALYGADERAKCILRMAGMDKILNLKG